MNDFELYCDVKNSDILYASLPEHSSRRKSVINNLKNQVTFAFLKSIDGRKWTEKQTESYLSYKMIHFRRDQIKKGRDWLTSGVIACAMTHRNMISVIGLKGKFCCEDDAVIESDAIKLISDGSLQTLLEGLDGLTLLDYRSRRNIISEKKPVQRIGKYSIHRVISYNLGSAACYFVPAKIAKRFVNFQTPINASPDQFDEMQKMGVFENLYIIHPKAARSSDFPTTMEYEYSKKTNYFFKFMGNIIWIRRLRYFLNKKNGSFNDSVTTWVDNIDQFW